MSQHVVWYDSAETGAPILNNTAGALIAVLDACLVNGFNLKSVTSLVVSGGVATATCNGHGFTSTYSKDVEIAGATPAGLNGRKQLTYVDTNTFRFDATGVADGAATGAITVKRSPLGWAKQFSGTNRAIYKRTDVTATSLMLRVDDTNTAPATATDARVVMVEAATDVDNYTAPSPTAGQVSGGLYWNRGANTTTAKQWTLVGDGKRFWLVTQHGATLLPAGNNAAAAFFGDFKSFRAGDAYNCLISGATSAYSGTTSNSQKPPFGAGSDLGSAPDTGVYIARAYPQTGGATGAASVGMGVVVSGYSATLPTYPSPVDNGLLVNPNVLLSENGQSFGYPIRGVMSGIAQILNRQPLTHQQIFDNVSNLPGRTLMALTSMAGINNAQFAVDITGPWE